MGSGQTTPKLDLQDASTGDPIQREAKPAGTVTEAIDRRTVRQAIMTQVLNEVADEILNSNAKVTRRDDKGNITVQGDLRDRYNKGEFPKLHALIENPELAFNTRRNLVFVVDKPEDPSIALPFGSINLVVFRNAMALGDGNSPVDPEEVAKRVVIRAGRASGYGERSKNYDRGCTGCK